MIYSEFKNSLDEIEKPLVDYYVKCLKDFEIKTVLEIGSGWGLFTRSALEVVDRVVTIDPIPHPRMFAENTKGFENQIERITATSQDTLKKLSDKSFDLIFVDGDHSYEAVKSDLEQAYRISKKIILLDDVWHNHNYDKMYGVMQAIGEFCLVKKLEPQIIPVAHGLAIIKI